MTNDDLRARLNDMATRIADDARRRTPHVTGNARADLPLTNITIDWVKAQARADPYPFLIDARDDWDDEIPPQYHNVIDLPDSACRDVTPTQSDTKGLTQ